MQLINTRNWITWILLPVLAGALNAQNASVTIFKKTKDANGNTSEIEIAKSGQEADDFDVQQYIDENEGENLVELRIEKLDSKGNKSKIMMKGDGNTVNINQNDNKSRGKGKSKSQPESRGFTDKPGEVIIMQRRDGLPLPPNASGVPGFPTPPDAPDAPDAPNAPGGKRIIKIEVPNFDSLEQMIERSMRLNDLQGIKNIRIITDEDGVEAEMDIDRIVEEVEENVEREMRELRIEIEEKGEEMQYRFQDGHGNRGRNWSGNQGNISDHKACLGVYPESVEGRKGARITSFTDFSPAEDAGMTKRDIITDVNGVKVENYGSLTEALSKCAIGEKAKVTFTRDGKEMSLDVRLKNCDGANYTACLGVDAGTYTQESKKMGALIQDFGNESPARTAGLNEGDVITALGEINVTSDGALKHALATFKPGEEVMVSYTRNGKASQQKVKLKDCNSSNQNRRETRTVAKNNCEENDAFLGVLSTISIVTDGEETTRDGESTQGFLIGDVVSSGPAEVAGLKEGDVITSINGIEIKSFDDLQSVMQSQKPGNNVDVRFLRAGKSEQRTVQLKSCKDRNARERIIVSERGKGDRERRTITIRKPIDTDARVNQAPTQEVKADDRSLVLNNFKTFPNPGSGKITVEFDAEAAPTVVSILDLGGREIFSEEMNTFSGRYSQEFDLTEFGGSALIVRIAQGGKVYSDQIVVTK
jgi:S1-C subfamily serine protease